MSDNERTTTTGLTYTTERDDGKHNRKAWIGSQSTNPPPTMHRTSLLAPAEDPGESNSSYCLDAREQPVEHHQCCPATHKASTRQRRRRRRSVLRPLVAVLGVLFVPSASLAAFHSPSFVTTSPRNLGRVRCVQLSAAAGKDEVTVNLERARAVLEKAKQKLASRDSAGRGTATMVAEREDRGVSTPSPSSIEASAAPPLPFFASREAPPERTDKRQKVIKSVDEATGLITTDGEKMARLSEEEAWEARSLFEVFENEIADKDAYSVTTKQLATRDVAASIWNLRKTLQSDDYRKIFDEKNWFIGEGN
jgi:hypothetical protein